MSDSQIVLPPSFVALYVPPGRIKPTEPYEVLLQRYELCEDMAQLLTERAGELQWTLGVEPADVLERMRPVLASTDTGLTPPEAHWVLRRLTELLDWPWPQWLAPPEA